jgi:26S proteasome regulatory subunit N5
VSVETIGSMEAREKLDFLLEQMRLCLARSDFVRTEIISKKVKPKHINDPLVQDLKLKYYDLMVTLHMHNDAYFAVCQAYEAVYNTESVLADPVQWKKALSKAAVFATLAPFDSEVSDLLARFKADKRLEELPVYHAALEDFTRHELIAWPLACETEYLTHTEFHGAKKDQLWLDLRKSVTQHNIRVVSGYYKRLTSARLTELLQLDADKMEAAVSEMVSSGQLFAKIDRCEGTVTFEKKPTPAALLNDWADDISQLLTLVDKTCHLINKENMVYGV